MDKIKLKKAVITQQRQDLSRAAIQAHVASTQSTHGQAPMASAARLIRLLRSAYPAIGAATEGAAQASLIDYLKAKIDDRADDLGVGRANPQIASTIELIDAISRRDDISTDHKKEIWTQMESIAGTCPDMPAWGANHENWGTNRVYNSLTGKDETVIASPAETLNLVCAAILDSSRYAVSDSGDEKDLGFRLASFCNRLLGLQLQKKARNYETCSAGRQHEMLFLLNQSYLDNPRDAALASPIHLIEDTEAFLQDTLTSYIDTELRELPAADRAKVVLDSIRWQSGLIDDSAEYPIVAWLKHTYKKQWGLKCALYMAQRCMDFGINPEHCKQKISDLMDNMPYLSLPASRSMLEPILYDIFRAEPLRARQQPVGGGAAAGRDDWDRLVVVSNAALEMMKRTISTETCEDYANQIRDFHKVLDVMQSLNHYKDLRVFIGAEEGTFHTAREQLQQSGCFIISSSNLSKALI